MAKVVLKNVNKIFEGSAPVKKEWYEFWKPATRKREVHVVHDVNLEIADGEFLVLVGPSGCGKTTTLRMVAGLEDISSGEIFIGDTKVNDLTPKDRDIAMVFQNYALYPHMSVYENMAFGLRLRKTAAADIEERVQKAASLLKIDTLLHRKPKELSGGQRQRVAMGRAIVRQPKVFLMDEPLSNLDAKLRVQMRAELQKLHRTLGVTTIYVTHDQTEAMTLGHRIVLMRDGLVQQMDTPLNIYERPANQYVAGFVGSPPMNFVSTRVVAEQGALFLKGSSFMLRVPDRVRAPLEPYLDQEVSFGIRAEDILDRATEGATFTANVEVFEPMGSEVYLHLSCGQDYMVARVGSQTQARLGSAMEVSLDMNKMHVFDKSTEAAIVHGQS